MRGDRDLLVVDVLDRQVPLRSQARPDWADVLRRADVASVAASGRPRAKPSGERRVARRGRLALVLVACAAAAVAIAPALASERFRELFGFTSEGTPVAASELALDQVSSLERVGFADGVRKLGERAGTAFYVGRSRSGAFCFATGPVGGPRPEFGVLACQGARSSFPSERMPIADLSPLRGHGRSNEVYVWKLVGFAADGVAAVAVRDTSGGLHSTPVSGNVYASEELLLAATEIVALDPAGTILYAKSLESSTPG